MRPLLRYLCVGVLLLGICPAPARAQMATPRSERPYRGLFASGLADQAQSLIVSGEFGGGYDDDLLAEARGVSNGQISGAPDAGSFGRASGRIAYALDTSHVSASAAAAGTTHYYGPGRVLRTAFGSGIVSLAPLAIGRNTTFAAGMTTVLQPFNLQAVFPVLFDPQLIENAAPDEERGTSTRYYVAETAHAVLSHQLSRRNRLALRYTVRNSDVPTGNGSLLYQDVGGSFSHTLAKGLDLRLGYGYREARYPSFEQANGDVLPAATVPSQTIDAGVDFNRALSISRRTTLTFGTGSTAYRAHGSMTFRATGAATLNRELGRSWIAMGSVSRRVVFEEEWQQPVLLDGGSVGISGLLTRRLQFATLAGVAHGSLTSGTGGTFESYTGSASLGMAMNRFTNLRLIYSYYQHRYGQEVVIPTGLPNQMQRQSIRATVTLWAPLMERARRPDAAR